MSQLEARCQYASDDYKTCNGLGGVVGGTNDVSKTG